MTIKNSLVPALAIVAAVILLFVGPIPQKDSYHQFADQRTLAGVANFWNVISNLPFALIAVWGFSTSQQLHDKDGKVISYLISAGFFFLTFGSGYYHLQPDNISLVYDRLPMSLIFMSFFSWIIYDRINRAKGFLLFIALNVLGISTVLYWIYTEQSGVGDLRWYAMVQFFPIIAIPLILWFYKSSFKHEREIIPIFAFFGFGKLAESYDAQIHTWLADVISGHTLKHVLMAAAGYYIVKMIRKKSRHLHDSFFFPCSCCPLDLHK